MFNHFNRSLFYLILYLIKLYLSNIIILYEYNFRRLWVDFDISNHEVYDEDLKKYVFMIVVKILILCYKILSIMKVLI